MKFQTIILCGSLAATLAGSTACVQIVHLGADFPLIGDWRLASQFLKAGNDAFERGGLREAEANYHDALNLCPFDENAALGLARCGAVDGDLGTAIKYYQTVINGHHEEYDIDIQTEYILVLNEAHRGPEAVTLYNHVVDLCRKGRVITPMEIVPPDFRLDGSDYDPVKLQAMTHLIRAMNSSTSDDKHIKSEMQKAVSLAPDSVNVYFCEGVLLSHSDKIGARKAFQQALTLDGGANIKVINRRILTVK